MQFRGFTWKRDRQSLKPESIVFSLAGDQKKCRESNTLPAHQNRGGQSPLRSATSAATLPGQHHRHRQRERQPECDTEPREPSTPVSTHYRKMGSKFDFSASRGQIAASTGHTIANRVDDFQKNGKKEKSGWISAGIQIEWKGQITPDRPNEEFVTVNYGSAHLQADF